jgi:hypothetical protein
MTVVPSHKLALDLLLLSGQLNAGVLHVEGFKLLAASVRK